MQNPKLEKMLVLKSGKKYYLCTYQNAWDAQKQRSYRSSTTTVGKIISGNKFGEIEWKSFYLELHPELQTLRSFRREDGVIEFKPRKLFSEFEQKEQITRMFGAYWVLQNLIKRLPLYEALRLTFNQYDDKNKILSVAYFLLFTTDNAYTSLPQFCKKVQLPWAEPITQAELHRLFSRISSQKIASFFNRINTLNKNNTGKITVYGSTSRFKRPRRFSWSAREELTHEENTSGANIVMASNAENGLPLYYRVLGNKAPNIIAIRHLLKVKAKIDFDDNVLFVGDRGYGSLAELRSFLQENIHFVLNVRRSHAKLTSFLNTYRPRLFSISSYHPAIGCTSVTQKISWKYTPEGQFGKRRKQKLYLHVYFDENIYNSSRQYLKQRISLVLDNLRSGEISSSDELEIIEKYLKDTKDGFFEVNEEALESRLFHHSIRMLVSDTISDPIEAYCYYFDRNEIWASFKLFQDRLGSSRNHAAEDETYLEGKSFIQFLSCSLGQILRKALFKTRIKNWGLPYNCDDVVIKMLNAIEMTASSESITFSESSSKMKDVMEDLNIPDPKTTFFLKSEIKSTQAAAEAEKNDCAGNERSDKLSREEFIFKTLSQ